MEYIYRFIEFINEYSLFSIVTLLIMIFYLIRLYQSKEEEEKYLGWKLIGFYILGGFNFNLKMNWLVLPIPLGFGIYYFGMKNKERPNAKIKNKSALLGMILMFIGIANGMIYEKAEYRERTINVGEANFYNLGEDYAFIKKEVGIDYVDLEAIELEYNIDGKINYLNYSLRNDKDFYNIFLDKGVYKVNITPHNGNLFWDFGDERNYCEADEFFNMLRNVKFNKYENVISYRIRYNNQKGSYENMEFYSLDQNNYSIQKLDKILAVNNAVGFEYNVFLNPTDENKESYKNEMYLTTYGRTEYIRDYDNIEIESIKNNNSITITDQEDLKDIYKKTKTEPYGWAPVTDLNITYEPDLYVKFSDKSMIGFCENSPFIRVDEDGVSVWYIGPSDIYTFMINKYFDASREENI